MENENIKIKAIGRCLKPNLKVIFSFITFIFILTTLLNLYK